jgi:hypothetical protein
MSEQERNTVTRPDDESTWEDLLRARVPDGHDVDWILDAIRGSDEPNIDAAGEVLRMMEEDTDLRSAITYADSVAVLQVLGNERDDGWVVDEERSGAIGSASVGVTWRYRMTHDWEPKFDPTKPQAELRGLPPTGRPLEANGFSIFGVDEKAGFTVRRYVDWAGLYTQLGIGLNWRFPIDEAPVLRRPPS